MQHPAKFSQSILDEIQKHVIPNALTLDPFAGVGRVHSIHNIRSIGIEIEPEWALLHPKTILGNALYLPFPDETFDAIITSCVYGNRVSDTSLAKDKGPVYRYAYTQALGRKLHSDNSGRLQWGEPYRQFHIKAWQESFRVLKKRAQFILNISDHYRKGTLQSVSQWHLDTLMDMGLKQYESIQIPTPRMKRGANRNLRPEFENLFVLWKES